MGTTIPDRKKVYLRKILGRLQALAYQPQTANFQPKRLRSMGSRLNKQHSFKAFDLFWANVRSVSSRLAKRRIVALTPAIPSFVESAGEPSE